MPGTTRYSATFDRPYEEEDEEDLPAVPPLTRRSRSASWQATTANGRPYTPLGGSRGSHARSASTDNGPQSSLSSSPAQSTERIPTRTTGKVPVVTSHNPFQFVKVGTCSLYKKAEEQLKKTQKIKQPEALKEEEEEWQTNLDSWKSRRRKMSQDVFRRQEEMKELLEMEEQPVGQQKKVKTFSEMLEERASRGRTLSLCLYSNPLGLDEWGLDNGKNDSEVSCNDTHQSSGSAESSNANSEDENDVFQNSQMAERNGVKNVNNTQRTRRTGAVHFLGNHNGVNNGISLSTDSGSNCDFKVSDLTLSGEMISDKCEPCQSGAFNDSGLDSLSSSHRAGDIPDSGSDFSQDSGSSLDCDSPGITGIPTTGTELLQEFSSKDLHPSNGILSNKEKIDGMELCLKLTLTDSKSQQYGFTINGGKDKGSPVTVASVINGSVSDLVGLKTGDHILAINKEDISTFSHSAVISSLKQAAESRQLELLLWRPALADVKQEKSALNGSPATTKVTTSENSSKKPVPQQTSNKDPNNKTTNGKATKELSVTESSVDKADIVDSQSNNKKSTPARQKDLNNKASAPPKSQKQEITASTVETPKNSAEAVTVAENQNRKSVESENEMFVDDLGNPSGSNNSKIPVAEKSPKVMGKKISKASQETKKNKSVVSDSSKSNESSTKTKDSSFEDSKDNSLNIIYQSQPSVPKAGSNAKESVTTQLEHSVSSSVDKKDGNESSNSPAQTPINKQESKFNDKLTFEATEILPVDKVAEQMERLILEQLEEEERLKEKPETLLGSVDSTTAGILLQEHELNSIDTPPRQAEPPKEKPPPPPTSSSCTNKDSPLKRVNSTKRIKKEIQKRRSDFLGIEKSEEEESTIPPPPDLENILKLECEQERKVREILGKESLHQRESSFEEEEIAKKEREIIESLETEERMKMAKHTVTDDNVSSSASDTSFSQVEVERIRKLQEERVRMEEERFFKEEQRIRLEEERQLREREEQIRREEAPKAVKDPMVFPTQSEGSAKNMSKQKDMPASNDVGNNSKTSKNESDPKILPIALNIPSGAANSCPQVCDVNKKQTTVKKTKAENKKSKADKQNIGSKTENKAAVKSETNGQSIGSKSENKITAESESNVQNNSSKRESKTAVESETNGQNIGSKSESKTAAKSETNEQNINSKSEGKTAVKLGRSGQNSGSKCENKTCIKSGTNVPQTQILQSENIPATTEKGTVLNSKNTKVCKSSEINQNVDPNKIITSQNEASKSDACSTRQKSKATGAFKNIQHNKQIVSQDENTKVDKKQASEFKPKESNISQNAKQSKDTVPQGEGLKTTVPKQRSEVSQVSANHLNGDVKSKVSVSKQKLQASENCQNVDLNRRKAPLDGNKHVSSQQMSNLQNHEQNKPLQTADVASKLCAVEQNSNNLEASQNIEINRKTTLQSVDGKPKGTSSSGSEVPQSPQTAKTDQKTMLHSVDAKPNCTSDNETKLLQNSQNVEQKQTAPQTEDIHSKTVSTEQKSKTVETPSNGKQIKMKESQDDLTKSTNSAPVEKPLALKTSKTVEKKQSTLPVELPNNKMNAPEQKRDTSLISQSTEVEKQTAPQTEVPKTNKSVPEQKPAGNMVRVRKKKKGQFVKPMQSENANARVNCPESPSQNKKCPASPTTHSKPEDKTGDNVLPDKQSKENASNVSDNKVAAVNFVAQKLHAASESECSKSLDQKSNPVSGNSPSISTVVENMSESKASSNLQMENASGASAITCSAAVLTSNSESTAPISSISPSVSSDALSQTGGGKNMENVCMKSASDDQSNIAKELTNNLVATKPLKKKEVIRKERERLRQEQEALQREREEYRRQMMKEQELLKDSQKSHAPDAPVSRVGAPPPLKPALPLPLTSLPHASQALKENVSYTSRSLPTNSVNNAAVGNHNTVGTSQSSSLLSPSHNTVARSKVTQNEAWGPHKVPVVKKQPDVPSESRYNQNHWLIQEAEMRRISEQKERQQRAHPSGDPRCGSTPFNQGQQYHPMHVAEENFCGGVPCAHQKPPAIPGVPSLVNKPSSYPVPTQMHSHEQQWNYGQPIHPTPQGRKFPITNVLSPGTDKIQPPSAAFSRNARVDPSLQAPTKPSRVIPMDRQEQMLSVSGRKRCSHCGEELGRGAAMIIESLQLYYHIQCFRCCVCQAQLGNGSCGTDVRVRNNKLHCHNCYSNDEAGLKFSQV